MENVNVLIIEDEIFAFMSLERSLKKVGFKNIFYVKTLEETSSILLKEKIDLIFSDIKLDKKYDGIDIALSIEEKLDIPIVFITGNKEDELYLKSSEVKNLAGFLLKPYRFEELKALCLITLKKYNLLYKQRVFLNDYSFDKLKGKVFYKNSEIALTKKELKLFELLFFYKNSYISYTLIKEKLWDDEFVSDTAIRIIISRFKKKLEYLDIKLKWGEGIGLFSK